MTEREKHIQRKIFENLYDELSKRKILKKDFCELLINNTPMSKCRIIQLMNETNKRCINLKELYYFANVLGYVNPCFLLNNIEYVYKIPVSDE